MKNIYTTGLIPSFCPISFPPHLLSSIYPYHPFIHLVIHLSTSLFLYPLRHSSIHFVIHLSTSSSIYPLRHSSIHFVIPLYTSSFLYPLRHSSIHFVIPLYTSSFLYPLRYSRVLYRHSRLLIVIPAQAGIQK